MPTFGYANPTQLQNVQGHWSSYLVCGPRSD